MSPNETLFLESTSLIVKEDIANSSFFQFSIWDFPGQIDFFDSTFESEKIFDNCGAIIFVIDAQVRLFCGEGTYTLAPIHPLIYVIPLGWL